MDAASGLRAATCPELEKMIQALFQMVMAAFEISPEGREFSNNRSSLGSVIPLMGKQKSKNQDWEIFLSFMKKRISVTVLLLLFMAGCASRSSRGPVRVGGPIWGFPTERATLSRQPIPEPNSTPYQTQSDLTETYLEGFREGWSTTLKQWANTRFLLPNDYVENPGKAKAWTEGFKQGQEEATRQVYNAARSK